MMLEGVSTVNTSSMDLVRKGRLVSVREYVEVNGHPPSKDEIITRKSTSGKVKQMCKLYEDDDSSDVPFEDRDSEAVRKTKQLDNGKNGVR